MVISYVRLYWPFVMLGIVLVCFGGPALAYWQLVAVPEAREAQLVAVAQHFNDFTEAQKNPYTGRSVQEVSSTTTRGYVGNYCLITIPHGQLPVFFAPARLGTRSAAIFYSLDVQVVRGLTPAGVSSPRRLFCGGCIDDTDWWSVLSREFEAAVDSVRYCFDKDYVDPNAPKW